MDSENKGSKCGQEIKKLLQVIPGETLEWGEISEKEMTWQEAKDWCKNKGDGWRMPTRVELLRAFDMGIFEPNSDHSFWSSTEYYYGADYAWVVHLDYGGTSSYGKPTRYYVRCVR